jgi:predicted translin family RNA/ssDNA-binding protein
MNDIRGTFDTLNRVYERLDEEFSQQGGLDNILSMHRRLREALFAISGSELATLLEEIEHAKQALETLKSGIDGLRSLKDAFKSATLPYSG